MDCIYLFLFIYLFIFWPCCTACGTLVPEPEIKPVPPALEMQSLKPWTTREVSCSGIPHLSLCWGPLVSSGILLQYNSLISFELKYIFFQDVIKYTHHVYVLCYFWLFVTPWTEEPGGLQSMGSHRQQYWSELLLPTSGDLPEAGIEPKSLASPALEGRFSTTVPTKKPLYKHNIRFTM